VNSKNILYLIGGIAVLAIVGTVFFFSPKTVLLPITGELAESLVKPQDPIVPEGVVGVGVGEGAAATPEAPPKNAFWSMKLVNETVTDADLDAMESAGIGIIEGEWGMADATPQKVLALLDRANARGMKLIMNFTENSAWGYAYGEMGAHQAPQWQKAEVQAYVRAIMKHPALFGYDVSNEAGENLPNGGTFRITSAQMKEAADSVRAIDALRPILIRMHYWDRFDGDFTEKNPFTDGIADIVMLNLYSNWSADGAKVGIPNMISLSAQDLVDKIRGVDPDAKVWLALGAFRESPFFLRPSASDLARDIRSALTVKGVTSISFFGWGPERYPDEGPGWYLPRDGSDLVEVIKSFTTRIGT